MEKGLYIVVCIISGISMLLLAPLIVLLVCFPLIQSILVLKLVKSRVHKTPSSAILLILPMKICANLMRQSLEKFSLII